MVEKQVVVVSNMLLKEISSVLGEIQSLICSSCFKTSEGKLRDAALKPANSLFKATIDGAPFGIISTKPTRKEWVAEIEVWMSNRELRESWAKAINLAAQQIFSNPAVGKIEWRITLSNKDMIEVAKSCGFTKQGELTGEGLNGELLILMGLMGQKGIQVQKAVLGINAAAPADIAEKDKIIKELETQVGGLESALKASQKEVGAKSELIQNLHQERADLQKQLEEKSAKLIQTEDDKGFKGTEIISALKQKISDLEAMNIQLENKNEEQAGLLEQKSNQIIAQAKTILELQKAADTTASKEETALSSLDRVPEEKMSDSEDKSIKNDLVSTETEIEAIAPEMPVEELESLISQAGLSKLPRKILCEIILHPGIQYPGIEKNTGISKNNIGSKINGLDALKMIARHHENPKDNKIVSFYPIKGIIQKLQEIAENRKNLGLPVKQPKYESRYKELGLDDFDIEVLKLIILESDRGLKQQEIITKIHEQQPGKTRASIQFRVNTSIRKLANLKLATNKPVGAENQSKPIMENIRQLPKELQKELGIQESVKETEIPVMEPAERVAEIKETVKGTSEQKPSPEKTIKPEGRATEVLTPHKIVVEILKACVANNGGGINSKKLYNDALEKGLTKDEAKSVIRNFKKGKVLESWGETDFFMINKEELVKI